MLEEGTGQSMRALRARMWWVLWVVRWVVWWPMISLGRLVLARQNKGSVHVTHEVMHLLIMKLLCLPSRILFRTEVGKLTLEAVKAVQIGLVVRWVLALVWLVLLRRVVVVGRPGDL